MKFIKNLLERSFFSKLLVSVFIANVLTLSFCNWTCAKVHDLVCIYSLFLLPVLFLVFSSTVKKTSFKITKGMFLWMLIVALILSLARIQYVLEWLPGVKVFNMICDDYPRLFGLISMTKSQTFPLKHFANQNFYFSYYYAAMLPLAVIKVVYTGLTLKSLIFIGNFIYVFLFLFSLLEVFNFILPNSVSIWICIYLCTIFSGLDWIPDVLLKGRPLFSHHEWWQDSSVFHGNAEIPSFFNSIFWTSLSHFASFMASVLSLIVLKYYRFKIKAVKMLLVGLLLISALYSSIYVVISAFFFGIVEYRVVVARFLKAEIILPLVIIFLGPVSIFFNHGSYCGWTLATFHTPFTGDLYLDKILSFPIWLVLVSLVEFVHIPFFVLAVFRQLTLKERMYFGASTVFFFSTYILDSGHNYSMRGMLLPSFVFFILFAKYSVFTVKVEEFIKSTRGLLTIVFMAILFSLGTFFDLYSHAIFWLNPHKDLRENCLSIDDRRGRYCYRRNIFPAYYLAERMVRKPVSQMYLFEREQLMFHPLFPFKKVEQVKNLKKTKLILRNP